MKPNVSKQQSLYTSTENHSGAITPKTLNKVSHVSPFAALMHGMRTDTIIGILKKYGRTEKDNESIYDYCQRLYFFKNFVTEYVGDGNQSIVKKMISEVRFEEFPKNQIIFEETQVSDDKMYVIITGSVSVHKRQKTNVFENDFEKFAKKKRLVPENICDMASNTRSKKTKKQQYATSKTLAEA